LGADDAISAGIIREKRTIQQGTGVATTAPPKYRAFLSYSHRDDWWADWLHDQLERYRVPRDLERRDTEVGPVPATLRPIFRDRDDFAAGHSLNEQTLAALAASRFLVVVCSPNAAQSHYVNEEIRRFKAMADASRVIAIIVDGEPGDPARECFPPALRFKVGADGRLTDEPEEPLAADVRPQGDGKQLALQKVIAALIGVPLDDLRKRDAIAERKRIWTMTSVAAVIALLVLATGYFAFDRWQRIAEQEQRTAEQAQRLAEQDQRIAEQREEFERRLEQLGSLPPEQRIPRALALRDVAKDQGRVEEAELLDQLVMASQAQLRAVELIGQRNLAEARRELDSASNRLDRLPVTTAWVRNQRAFNDKTLAQAFLANGNTAEAGPYIERARNMFEQVKSDPRASPRERTSAIHGLGNVEHLRGDDRAAIALYNEAGRLDPANGFIWYDRFVSYLKLAERGQVDLAGMRDSVTLAKKASSLTPREITSLEAELRRWETACASGARAC
jgi:tetratricopeptide (TPR) repeat protein